MRTVSRSEKVTFKTRIITKDKREKFTNDESSIHQEDITIAENGQIKVRNRQFLNSRDFSFFSAFVKQLSPSKIP